MIHKEERTAIYTYQPQESTIDFENHLSLLLFTSGCNFVCRYCHNPELLKKRKDTMMFSELTNLLEYAKRNWIDAISISGGEPTYDERIIETCRYIKEQGFLIKLDTQGSYPDTLKSLLPFVDYVAMDYKMPCKELQKLTQVKNNCKEIKKSLSLLIKSDIQFEIRTTVCEVLHDDKAIEEIANELKGIQKYVLQPFVPRDTLPDPTYRKMNRTDINYLQHCKAICEKYIPTVEIRSFS